MGGVTSGADPSGAYQLRRVPDEWGKDGILRSVVRDSSMCNQKRGRNLWGLSKRGNLCDRGCDFCEQSRRIQKVTGIIPRLMKPCAFWVDMCGHFASDNFYCPAAIVAGRLRIWKKYVPSENFSDTDKKSLDTFYRFDIIEYAVSQETLRCSAVW